MKRYWHIPLALDLGLILIALDQISKLIATKKFQQPYELIEGFFRFQYAENTGVAFSIQIPSLQIIILNIILLIGVIYIATKELNFKKPITSILTVLILAGAIGNMTDRIRLGYVVDFISIWKYPIFNLADIYIVLGVLGLLVFYGKIKKKT